MVFRSLMSVTRSQPTTVLAALTIAAGSFLLAAGCSRSEAAQVREEAAAAPGKSKVDESTYTVEMKAVGSYKAGTEGKVEVTLVPKGAYHINDKYPHKFKATDPAPDGLKYPKAILKKEDGTFSASKGSFSVPFVASKAGKAKISGTFSFSVCSDANCVMDKVDLALEVDVK